jgi:hypothetical protein
MLKLLIFVNLVLLDGFEVGYCLVEVGLLLLHFRDMIIFLGDKLTVFILGVGFGL